MEKNSRFCSEFCLGFPIIYFFGAFECVLFVFLGFMGFLSVFSLILGFMGFLCGFLSIS